MNAKQRRVERRRVLRELQQLAEKFHLKGWTRRLIRTDMTAYGLEKFFWPLWRRFEQVGGKNP